MSATPLRIVHVASGREWRGGQRQVLLLAAQLAQDAGLSQTVITTRGSPLEERLRAAGVPVRAAGWRAGLSPGALWALMGEARQAPSLLHAHDAHALTLAGAAGLLARRPLVVTRRVDFHLRRRGFWVRAARVIAISEAVRRILLEDGVSPERITVVHSGIDLDEVRATRPGAIRHELGLPSDPPLLVTVAALVPHKDPATAVTAAAELRDQGIAAVWAIAGAGPLRPLLERRIGELSLRDRVHLLGHIPDPLRLIAAASAFVLTSVEEGLGTSVLDAMALGVPVVATRAGGVPEILEQGAGLLVEPRNPFALAAAVARVLSDPALGPGMISRAARRVQQFSAGRMAEAVLQVYRSVVPGR